MTERKESWGAVTPLSFPMQLLCSAWPGGRDSSQQKSWCGSMLAGGCSKVSGRRLLFICKIGVKSWALNYCLVHFFILNIFNNENVGS